MGGKLLDKGKEWWKYTNFALTIRLSYEAYLFKAKCFAPSSCSTAKHNKENTFDAALAMTLVQFVVADKSLLRICKDTSSLALALP